MLGDTLINEIIATSMVKEAGKASVMERITDAERRIIKKLRKKIKEFGEEVEKVLKPRRATKASYRAKSRIGRILESPFHLFKKPQKYSVYEHPILGNIEAWWDTAAPAEKVIVPLALGGGALGTAALVGNVAKNGLPPELLEEVGMQKESAIKPKDLLNKLLTKGENIGRYAWGATKGGAKELYQGIRGAGQFARAGADDILRELGLAKYFRRRGALTGYSLGDIISLTGGKLHLGLPGGSFGAMVRFPKAWWQTASDAERALAALMGAGAVGYGGYKGYQALSK